MKIVWDLCGGSQNSVRASLGDEYDIYTFDVVEPKHDKQFKIDLTDVNVLELLSEFPKPDIIVASPLCTAFSVILNTPKVKDVSTRLGIGYNPTNRGGEYYVRTSGEIKSLKENNNFFSKMDPVKIQKTAILCLSLMFNVCEIIKHFKPKHFYIENPQNSIMWDMIKRCECLDVDYHLNKTNYYCYDENFSKKPTIFLSDVKMNLRNYQIPKEQQKFKTTSTRSKINNYKGANKNENGPNVIIPKELIRDIFRSFENDN